MSTQEWAELQDGGGVNTDALLASDGLTPAQQAVVMASVRENMAQAAEIVNLAEPPPKQLCPKL